MKKIPITDEDMEALQGIMQKHNISLNNAIHFLVTGDIGKGKVRRAKFFFPATLKIEDKALDDFKMGKYDRLIIKRKEDRYIHEDSFRTLMNIMERGNYTFDKLIRGIVEQERRKKIRLVNGRMMFQYNKVKLEEFVKECKKNGIDPQEMIDVRTRALKEYGKDMERLRQDAISYCARKKMEDYLNVFLKWNPKYTVKVDGIKARVVLVSESKREQNEYDAKYARRTDKRRASKVEIDNINMEELFNERV